MSNFKISTSGYTNNMNRGKGNGSDISHHTGNNSGSPLIPPSTHRLVNGGNSGNGNANYLHKTGSLPNSPELKIKINSNNSNSNINSSHHQLNSNYSYNNRLSFGASNGNLYTNPRESQQYLRLQSSNSNIISPPLRDSIDYHHQQQQQQQQQQSPNQHRQISPNPQQQQQFNSRFDWSIIQNLDLNQVAKENDLKPLEYVIESIIECNFDQDAKTRAIDQDICKVIKSMQLFIEIVSNHNEMVENENVKLQQQYQQQQQYISQLKTRNMKQIDQINELSKEKTDLFYRLEKMQHYDSFDNASNNQQQKLIEARYNQYYEQLQDEFYKIQQANSKWIDDVKNVQKQFTKDSSSYLYQLNNSPSQLQQQQQQQYPHYQQPSQQQMYNNNNNNNTINQNNRSNSFRSYSNISGHHSIPSQQQQQQVNQNLNINLMKELIREELVPFDNALETLQNEVNTLKEELQRQDENKSKQLEKEKKKIVQLHKKTELLKERIDRIESALVPVGEEELQEEEDLMSDIVQQQQNQQIQQQQFQHQQPNQPQFEQQQQNQLNRITSPPSRTPQYISIIGRREKLLCYFKHSNEQIEEERLDIENNLNVMLSKKGITEKGITKEDLDLYLLQLENERKYDNNYDEQFEMRNQLENYIDEAIATRLYSSSFVDYELPNQEVVDDEDVGNDDHLKQLRNNTNDMDKDIFEVSGEENDD